MRSAAVVGFVLCGTVLQPGAGEPVAVIERLPPALPVAIPAVTTAEPVVDRRCPAVGRIVLIGDSYGEGLGPYLRPWAAGCGVSYVWDARRGTSVTQWVRDGWIGPVLEAKPQLVVISLGGNDFLRQDVDVVQASVTFLVARIRDSGARVLWVEPLSLPYADRAGIRRMWKDAVGENDWFASEHLEYKRHRDRIHPHFARYGDWARLIWPWLVARTHEPGVEAR